MNSKHEIGSMLKMVKREEKRSKRKIVNVQRTETASAVYFNQLVGCRGWF